VSSNRSTLRGNNADEGARDTKVVRARNRLWTAYGLLGLLLLAYIIALSANLRVANGLPIRGFGVDAFEFVVAVSCLAEGVVNRSRRGVALFLGCALLSWCAGDIALTIESIGGRTTPTPSVADVFYLGFYPLAYVAVVQFMRTEVRHLTTPGWLDGVVAGLGAAAICAAFAFHTIVHSTGGSALSASVNLAYPIGDLLLLALVVGGTAVLPGRGKAPWILLAGACSLNAAGDTFNLFQSTLGSLRVGIVFNAVAWPGAFMLMSIAMWLKPRPGDPLVRQRPVGFLLPGIAAAGGLSILLVGTLHQLSRVSIGLATATLILVGVRLALSARGLRVLTEQRHKQSMTDDLTGLGNRRYLFHLLAAYSNEQAAAASEPKLAFLFLDLDHFKEINDSFGHSAGDELLRQLGPRLSSALRGSDVVVRLGGDEFAIVLFNADSEYATMVAERLMSKLQEPFALDFVSASVGASIGIALMPIHATATDDLLRCADTAMYRAKLGPGPIEMYNQHIDDDGNLLRLAEELREAVALAQFILHYQPQLDLRTGEICGVEALLRWPHPRLGMVPPMKFLPIAEEAGLMPSLTALVLDGALGQCAAWRGAGHRIAISINASPSNLLDDGFTGLIRSQLEHHRLPASALVLEITETCVISDYQRSRVVIEELRELGVTVSIDDFGAGFTSLAHLGDLAVGELKLDRIFVTGLTLQEKVRDLELVRSTIELGHSLGLRVVAEGVEDLATLDLLGRLGCDLAQGYFISRPMPAGDLRFVAGIAEVAEAILNS